MKCRKIFTVISMGATFCVFLFSLIAPMYLFFGGNSISSIVYGRIPGIGLRFGFFDRVAISAFFLLLIVFFFAHILSEKGALRKFLCMASCIYAIVYLLVINQVVTNGLVIFDFPIISIPLWVVLVSKFFILVPAGYFFLIGMDVRQFGFVRFSAFFHAATLVLIGVIKVFEILFPANMRMVFFDISTTLYLISLAMETFFMYRKYYSEE